MPPRHVKHKRYKRRTNLATTRRKSRGYGSVKIMARKRRFTSRHIRTRTRRVRWGYGPGTANHGKTMSINIGRFRRRRNLSKFRAKVIEATTPKNVLKYTGYAGYAAAPGICGWMIPGRPLMHNVDLESIAQIVPSFNYTGLFNYGTGMDASKTFQITRASQVATCQNASTGTINVRAYKCKLRKDLAGVDPAVPSTQWQLGYLQNQRANNTTYPGSTYPLEDKTILYQGWLDIKVGVVDATQLPASSYRFEPSVTLFNNPVFTSQFKIIKTESFKMSPGEIKNFDTVHNKPRYVNCETLNTGKYLATKPFEFWVIQFWGQPAVDSAAAPRIGYAQSEMIAIIQTKYEYQWMANNFKTQITYDVLPSAAPPQMIVNETTNEIHNVNLLP